MLACCVFVFASHALCARAETSAADPQESSIPLVQDILGRPLPADRLGVEILANVLERLGFKRHAASFRTFDERRAIARLLGELSPKAGTVGEAIRIVDEAPSALEEAVRIANEEPPSTLDALYGRLATQAIVFDFRAPVGDPPANEDPTRPQPEGATTQTQAQFDLRNATSVQPGIWRAPSGVYSPGHPELSFNRYFIRGIATNRMPVAATVDIAFTLTGAAGQAISLDCANQHIAVSSPSPVYCAISRRTVAELDDASAIAALASLQQGELTAVPKMRRLTTDAPQRTFYPEGFGGVSQAESDEALQASMAASDMLKAAGCTELGQCSERLAAKVRHPDYLLVLVAFVLMAFLALARWRSDTVSPASLTFARVAFALYLMFVALTLALDIVDAPGGSLCRGGGLCGLLGFLATFAASLPWSWLLLMSHGAGSASDDQATMWLFIAINLAWLGFMAVCRGRGAARA
ncbi:hypothetical protein [Dokdonella soli]|uniref:Uncharacterized protein n=1 Tax=Dokdonella soli TaxID=529810 RepID=A0ABN1ISS6_9GAMM